MTKLERAIADMIGPLPRDLVQAYKKENDGRRRRCLAEARVRIKGKAFRTAVGQKINRRLYKAGATYIIIRDQAYLADWGNRTLRPYLHITVTHPAHGARLKLEGPVNCQRDVESMADRLIAMLQACGRGVPAK